jgi:hypothetical protein
MSAKQNRAGDSPARLISKLIQFDQFCFTSKAESESDFVLRFSP